MSSTNETRHMKWHKTCKYICRLDAIFCSNKNVGIKINVDPNVKN